MKKKLEKDISTLSNNEHNEILNIIRNNKQKYSENNAGIYFNLKFLDDDTITKIIQFVKFSKKNKIKLNIVNEKETKNKPIKEIKVNEDLGEKYTLDKESIETELIRLKK